jgi:hypothetical protein
MVFCQQNAFKAGPKTSLWYIHCWNKNSWLMSKWGSDVHRERMTIILFSRVACSKSALRRGAGQRRKKKGGGATKSCPPYVQEHVSKVFKDQGRYHHLGCNANIDVSMTSFSHQVSPFSLPRKSLKSNIISEQSPYWEANSRSVCQEISHILWYIALMMAAVITSETSVNFYETTRRNIPEESSSYFSDSYLPIPLNKRKRI